VTKIAEIRKKRTTWEGGTVIRREWLKGDCLKNLHRPGWGRQGSNK